MRCHPEEEYEQPFGVLVADKLRGVRVAEVAERHLEEGRPVQVLRHLHVLMYKMHRTKMTISGATCGSCEHIEL